MPVSLAKRPGGGLRVSFENSCVPSPLERLAISGLKAPATGASVPASKEGALGRAEALVEQEPWPAAGVVVSKESVGKAELPSGALQGVKEAVVVCSPQVEGVLSGALAPSKKSSLKSSKGSWGLCWTVVLSCPVLGSGLTLPASFTTTPVWGSETVM